MTTPMSPEGLHEYAKELGWRRVVGHEDLVLVHPDRPRLKVAVNFTLKGAIRNACAQVPRSDGGESIHRIEGGMAAVRAYLRSVR